MNYFCDSGGVIFHVDTERVFQGSANANVINFFGAFPPNAEVLIAYQLPDGTWTDPIRMTPIAQLSNVLDGKGNAYAGWQTRIGARLKMENNAPVKDENDNYVYEPDYRITKHYGTVLVQFFVYANAGNGLGAQIATASSSFLVEKGIPIDLPDTLTDYYKTLLVQILAAISDKNGQIDTNAEGIANVNAALQSEAQERISSIETVSNTLQETNANVERIDSEKISKDGDEMTGPLTVGEATRKSKVESDGLSVSVLAMITKYGYGGVQHRNVKFKFPMTKNADDTFAMVSDVGAILQAAKDYTDNEIAMFDFIKVVSELPEVGLLNKIYCVPKTDATGNDFFDEWIWVNKGTEEEDEYAWEFQGTKQASLSLVDYLKIVDLANALIAEFNTPTVKLSDTDKTAACDWVGALKKDTSVTTSHQAYVKAASGATTMWNMDNGPTPSAICVRDGNGRLRIAEPLNGADGVNKTYFDANKGAVWYKHTMTQTVEGIGTFDLLIVSTRATVYTSGADIYNSWIAGEIDTFFNSSVGNMGNKIAKISTDAYMTPAALGVTGLTIGYNLNVGAFSYRETIQKI